MSRRATGVLAISVILAYFAGPTNAHAAAPVDLCPSHYNASQAPIVFDHTLDEAEYSPSGLLIYRLNVASSSAIGNYFQMAFEYFTDHCEPIQLIETGRIDYVAETEQISIRFSSTTAYEIWDDTHSALLMSGSALSPIPPYAGVLPYTYRDPSTFNTGHVYRVNENRPPPLIESTITRSEGCPSIDNPPILPFDGAYERAEYVEGLLRVHLRFKGDSYPSVVDTRNPSFSAVVISAGDDCSRIIDPFAPFITVISPSKVWYFSYRFTSPTHWVLWDDENDRPFADETRSPFYARCEACSGDVPEGTKYVYFLAQQSNFWSGGRSYFSTTPFSPVEPAPPEPETCTQGEDPSCNSNVMFIPGLKATELYEGSSKRWLPGLFNFDGQHLVMTEDGESVNEISVGKPISSVSFASTEIVQVYGDFFEMLDELRSSGRIADWQSAPYDWRYDVFDVVGQDQHLRDGTSYNLQEQIRTLAASSRTKKVTIIAHSNGGLVGKALLFALGEDATELVDRFVMVGSPQLGTPSAVAAMLHGIGQGLPVDSVPFAMSAATSRVVSENMPGAYGLLPIGLYIATVAESVVEFDQSVFTEQFRSAYGSTINTAEELRSFMLGTGDGRIKPPSSDIFTPTILNSTLLSEATVSRSTLEGWSAPADVEVIQIAGWGLDTVRGYRYKERSCSIFAPCNTFLDIEPIMTAEGDATVVSPSAGYMTGVESYYLDMSAFNRANGTSWTHVNMLAATSLQDLLADIITGRDRAAPFVSTAKPTTEDVSKRLHVSVHSPVTLGIRDSLGRYTGVIPNPDPQVDIPVVVQEIPNTYYFEFGEGKYIGFESSEEYEIVMRGTGSGSFTVEINQSENNTITKSVAYSDIPVSTTTQAALHIQDLQSSESLSLDIDSDGNADVSVNPDTEAQSVSYLVMLVKERILQLQAKDKVKANLLKKIASIEKKIERNKKKVVLSRALTSMIRNISKKEKRGRVPDPDAQALIDLLAKIESTL